MRDPESFVGGAWAPWYTEHKILNGLKDAWILAGNAQAKGVALRLADWFGAMTDPLKFLHDNNITGVVIWPGDAIPDSYLATLKTALASSYDYIDCKGEGAQNAGIFLLRPLPPEVRLP